MSLDDVTFVQVALRDGAQAATIALYRGMTAVELQAVVRGALSLPTASTCAGFLVTHRADEGNGVNRADVDSDDDDADDSVILSSAKKGRSKTKKRRGGGAHASAGACERLVPLTVACVSPEVLNSPGGYVTVLVAKTPGGSNALRRSGETEPADVDERTLGGSDITQRVQRLVEALRDEDKSLSSFESAVLTEICRERASDVLSVMRSGQSLSSKKQFLLSLVRGQEEEVRAPSSTGSGAARARGAHGSTAESTDSSAQIDLICKKVVSIAHTVFSPHVQSDLMTEASLYRDKHRKLASNNGSRGRGLSSSSTSAPDVNVSSIMELLGVVEKLLNKHALQEEQSVKLIRLILTENRILFSSLQSYKMDFNLNELENTIKRMAALGSASSAPTIGDIPEEAKRHRMKNGASSPRKTKRKDRRGFIVRPHDILHTLYQKSMITTLELDLLRALVNQNDSQVLTAVDEYEQSRQLNALRDQLVNIVEEITVELGDEEKSVGNSVKDPEDALAASLDNWQENLIQFVQRWFSLRKLTADQVHVLRNLIEEEHNLLQSAYEVYASDGDDTELLDTLQRIAKLQLQVHEGALLQAFAQIVEQHCHVLRDHEKNLVKQLFSRRNELVRAAWEVYEVERNVEDFGDTLLRIARFTTRQDSKIRLVEVVGEMMRRELIRSHEADGLIRLYEEKNEAMIAANEAFESDGDVKELVETLSLIVKHANFGDPPQCSSPRRVPPPTSTPPSSPVSNSGAAFHHRIASSKRFEPESDEYLAARLVEILEGKGRLATWQSDLLFGLLSKSDQRLLATVDVYNEDRDARELVDTLWRLCDLTAWDQNKGKILTQWVEPLEREGAVLPGVLRELIETRDDRLIAAFVVYLGDGNADEFSDTLLRLAHIVANHSRAIGVTSSPQKYGAPLSSVREDDRELGTVEMESLLSALVVNGEIYEHEQSVIHARIADSDALTLAAFDVYHETRDSHDFVDTIRRIIEHGSSVSREKPTRTNAMEKQLLHFVSELALDTTELVALKRSIARKDSIVEAAVEVFETEKDEEDFKDTLRRIASHLVAASHT